MSNDMIFCFSLKKRTIKMLRPAGAQLNLFKEKEKLATGTKLHTRFSRSTNGSRPQRCTGAARAPSGPSSHSMAAEYIGFVILYQSRTSPASESIQSERVSDAKHTPTLIYIDFVRPYFSPIRFVCNASSSLTDRAFKNPAPGHCARALNSYG